MPPVLPKTHLFSSFPICFLLYPLPLLLSCFLLYSALLLDHILNPGPVSGHLNVPTQPDSHPSISPPPSMSKLTLYRALTILSMSSPVTSVVSKSTLLFKIASSVYHYQGTYFKSGSCKYYKFLSSPFCFSGTLRVSFQSLPFPVAYFKPSHLFSLCLFLVHDSVSYSCYFAGTPLRVLHLMLNCV
jgi:hypothetical protein